MIKCFVGQLRQIILGEIMSLVLVEIILGPNTITVVNGP